MSGIRFKPKYTVFPQSPELKKSLSFTYFKQGRLQFCCNKSIFIPRVPPVIPKNLFFDGGSPLSSGSLIKDGGLPSLSGVKIYDGGKP